MMTRNRNVNVLTVAAVAMGIVGVMAGVSQAQVITPTAAVSDPADTDEALMINGSGLSGVGDILTQTHAKAGGGNYYSSQGTVDPDVGTGLAAGLTLTFTLPANSTVGEVHQWVSGGYVGNAIIANWGVRTFDISFSTDGGVTFPTTITGATLGDFVKYDETLPEYLVTAQTKTFTQQTGVDAIRLSNIYCFNEIEVDRVAIMEIRFGEGSAPPTTPGTLIYGK